MFFSYQYEYVIIQWCLNLTENVKERLVELELDACVVCIGIIHPLFIIFYFLKYPVIFWKQIVWCTKYTFHYVFLITVWYLFKYFAAVNLLCERRLFMFMTYPIVRKNASSSLTCLVIFRLLNDTKIIENNLGFKMF